jgi:hypothetical protein
VARTRLSISPEALYLNSVPKMWFFGHDSLQRRLDHLHRRRREHVKVEVESIDPPVEDLVNLLDVFLEANAFAHLEQMVAPDARMELGIMQE